MRRWFPEDLESLRWSVGAEYAHMPDEALGEIVDSAISGLPEGTAEDFMKTLRSVGKAVAPTLQRVAPAIAQGAASGAMVGGPWGALIGTGVKLGTEIAGGKPATPSARPAAPATPAPAAPGAPAVPALPTGQGAAATLLSLFDNPAVKRAFTSQLLGGRGDPQVRTASGTDLPRAAINALLMQLLANATEELPEAESTSEQSYLQDEAGEYLIDPASPEQHAALVLARMQPPREEALGYESESEEFSDSPEWLGEGFADSEAGEWIEAEDSAESVRFY